MQFYEDLMGIFVKNEFPVKKSVLVENAKDILSRVMVARGVSKADIKPDLDVVKNLEDRDFASVTDVHNALLESEVDLKVKNAEPVEPEEVKVVKAKKAKRKSKKVAKVKEKDISKAGYDSSKNK